MLTLSATLLAAQKKARGKPIFQLLITDKLGPHQRLTWTQLYSDSQDDQPHCMVIADDNSIVRVCCDSGTAKYQRITSPTTTSQWTTWTTTGSTCSTANQMSLAASGAKVWWFYISADNHTLYCRESTDYGASWGGATTVHTCTHPDELESVAVAHRTGTDAIVFFSVHTIGTHATCHLYVRSQTSGAWGGASSWGKTALDDTRGLTCHKSTDYRMIYAAYVDAFTFFGIGEAVNQLFVWTLYSIVYGGGGEVAAGTWANPVLLDRSDTGSAYGTAWPSLTYVDMHRAIYSAYLTGTDYSRLVRMQGIYGATFLETTWTDAWPFLANAGTYGSVIDFRSGGDGYVYVSHSNAAYRAKAAGDGYVNLGDRLVKYRVLDRWSGWKGAGVAEDYGQNIAAEVEAEIWLDNHDGDLNTLGSGDYAPVKRGSMVELRRGCHTSAGDEYGDWPTLWLEDWEHVVDFQGRCYLVLYCIGGWGLMAAYAAQRQYHWEDGDASVWTIAERLFALAGFELTSAGEASTLIATLQPAIVINPGEDLRAAALKALSKVPDFVYWEDDQPYVKELADDETSDYTYGGSGNHVVIAGSYGARTPGYNHIEVFSTLEMFGAAMIPHFGDDVDYDDVNLVGHRLQKIFDYAYDTDAECQDRAAAQLRKHDATKSRGQIETLPNVGLQLLDVITVTDPRAGVSSELYRVRGIEEVYDTTKEAVIYRQRVLLSAP